MELLKAFKNLKLLTLKNIANVH